MDSFTPVKDIIKDTIDNLEKSYQILILLATFVVITIFSGQYTKNGAFYKELRTLREIYKSLYVYSGITYFFVVCCTIFVIILLITLYKKDVDNFCLRLLSLLILIILYYCVIIWLILFNIFGYTGELNYIFPNMNFTNSFSGTLGMINLFLGILFMLFVAHLPIQAKRA